jgi:hypothetical protein
MPRIPRGQSGSGDGPLPEERSVDGPTPSEPPTQQHSPAGTSPGAAAPASEQGGALPAPEGATVVVPDESPTTEAPAVGAPPSEGATTEAPAVAQSGGATAAGATAGAPAGSPSPDVPLEGATADGAATAGDPAPGFRARTRMRRRLRYLRRLRELAFRDLGGLVFDLHRFGRDRGDLVQGKLDALGAIDGELRTLEHALRDHRDFTDLREAGIAACPRCGTIHDTDANFCPGCGTALRRTVVRDAAPLTVAPADGDQPAPAEQQQQPNATPS